MSDHETRHDLESALGSEFVILREMPQPSGFHTFLAKSASDGSQVEIKTVPASLFNGRFPVRESDLAHRRVRHPNIVPMLEAGQHGDTFFWISPEIDGRTFSNGAARRVGGANSCTSTRNCSRRAESGQHSPQRRFRARERPRDFRSLHCAAET